ncbi:MAG: hypothetical protein R8G34_04790 [Paracoccaceae bacterium]|nr:hypothetical protein [Paracoccaceae bacterium]
MIERSINSLSPPIYISSTGQKFDFAEYEIDADPAGENDIYLFCTEGIFGFNPVFISNAKDLQGDDVLEGPKRKGATKLLVHSQPKRPVVGLKDAEALLINELRPQLNVQKKARTGGSEKPDAPTHSKGHAS